MGRKSAESSASRPFPGARRAPNRAARPRCMAGGWESFGVDDELLRGVQAKEWLVPSAVQDEAIPVMLSGRDVMVAAETGSGKTGAFALPILQVLLDQRRRNLKGRDRDDQAAGDAPCASDWALSTLDRDVAVRVGADGLSCEVATKAWAGVRSRIGLDASLGGKFYFEVAFRLSAGDVPRVGVSRAGAALNLGTDAGGWGYGGTGKKSHARRFDDYGGAFGDGAVVGVLLDLDAKQLSFSRGDASLGAAFDLPSGGALFPTVCLKGGRAELAVSRAALRHLPAFEALGFAALGDAPAAQLSRGADASASAAADAIEPGSPMALVLEPTKELAVQVSAEVAALGAFCRPPCASALVVGGAGADGCRELSRSAIDVAVGTPGRVLDMLRRGGLRARRVCVLVLDEGDRLLEEDAAGDVLSIFNLLPKGRVMDRRLQVALFSATLHARSVAAVGGLVCEAPEWVDLKGRDHVPENVHHVVYRAAAGAPRAPPGHEMPPLASFTDGISRCLPAHAASPADLASQAGKESKLAALLRVIDALRPPQALIFCRTNVDCDNLERFLRAAGGGAELGSAYSCRVLAGQRADAERRESLRAFREGEVRFLVATDVAARGIDVKGLPAVLNMTLPDAVENYVHRVGRVGRADAVGIAVSIVGTAPERVWYHTCKSRGRRRRDGSVCTNAELKERGGCTVWYHEEALLEAVEARLRQKVPEMVVEGGRLRLPKAIEDATGGDVSLYGLSGEEQRRAAEARKPDAARSEEQRALRELEQAAQRSWAALKTSFGSYRGVA